MRYVDDEFNDCLSNLLAVGFNRFEIDLYWDHVSDLWSLCPVATSSSIQKRGLNPRQITTTNSSSPFTTDSNTSNPPTTSVGDTSSTPTSLPDSTSAPLISAGPYVCITTIDISVFIDQLLDYLQETQTTLDAHMLYIFFNIHATLSNDQLPENPPKPLPDSSNLLGNQFSGNFSEFLYTPEDLRSDRANLNSSWYTVAERYRPVENYYSVTIGEHDIVSTEDGWPSEGFVEFSRGKRLLLGWGTVDVEMASYDFEEDSKTIFGKDYLQNMRAGLNMTTSNGPGIDCFLQDTGDLSRVNSSWAAARISPSDHPTVTPGDITSLLNLTSNTTNCGISPILNGTVLEATADDNYGGYQNFSYATIWSWAPGEPKNYTIPGSTPDFKFRCATANPNLVGRWAVADCSQEYYAACRSSRHPYNWTISGNPTSYFSASDACPNGYVFDPPMTALENSYLNQAIRRTGRNYDNHGIWVDFNCLDVPSCWVTGGVNATCPYDGTYAENPYLRKRYILVSIRPFELQQNAMLINPST